MHCQEIKNLYRRYNDKDDFSCYSYLQKEKSGIKMPGKEIMTMNAVIRNDYFNRERYEALSKEQGLVFICSNKIMRERCCKDV